MAGFAYYPEENLSSIEKALKEIEHFFSRVEEKSHLFSDKTSPESKSKIIIAEQQMEELQDTLRNLQQIHQEKKQDLQSLFQIMLEETENIKRELTQNWEKNPDTEQTALCKDFMLLSQANKTIAACSQNLHYLDIIHVIEKTDFEKPQILPLIEEWNIWCKKYTQDSLQTIQQTINYNQMLLTSIEDSYSTSSIG